MNILDENIDDKQRLVLRARGIIIHQIGVDVGHKGMDDEQIIPFLHSLRDTSFFSRDEDFGLRQLCHPRYCLVCLLVDEKDVAKFVLRVLRHPELNTKAKRMDSVLRVSYEGMGIWRRHAERAHYIHW